MNDELNLTLPERGKTKGRAPKALLPLLMILLIVGLSNLAILLFRPAAPERGRGAGLSAQEQKELALKLEKQGLSERAAAAWKAYLDAARPGGEERSKIWFRIGTIYQDSQSYDDALDAFYRSELHEKDPDLEHEISRRIQECLEGAGKFAALRYELADRVGMDKTDDALGDAVVAEIGSRKITKAEVDRRIEEQIERQLARLRSLMPAEQLKSQKETLLNQFASGQARVQILNQIVFEEILYRKARQDGLADDPLVRSMLKDAERSVLAQEVLDRELAAKINITAADLQAFYEAHKDDFAQPGDGDQRPFEDVQGEVYKALFAREAAEVQNGLLAELKDEYDVVIHTSGLAGEAD